MFKDKIIVLKIVNHTHNLPMGMSHLHIFLFEINFAALDLGKNTKLKGNQN